MIAEKALERRISEMLDSPEGWTGPYAGLTTCYSKHESGVEVHQGLLFYHIYALVPRSGGNGYVSIDLGWRARRKVRRLWEQQQNSVVQNALDALP